jgi:hypothetical protein
VIDYTVISTAGRNLERWCMSSGLRFLATLGTTKDAEQLRFLIHYLQTSLNVNAIDLSSAKPSPEGWVRGNKDKEKSLFKSPHPIPFDAAQDRLLPEGEGVRVLKSTVLSLNVSLSHYCLGQNYE